MTGKQTYKRIVSAKESKRLDKIAQEVYGIPSLLLMENAGREISQHVIAVLKKRKRGSVVIICGVGNNGGDGFVAARHLFNAAIKVKIFVIGKLSKLRGDAKTNFEIIAKMGLNIFIVEGLNDIISVKNELDKADLIVDAIFGIGLARGVGGIYGEVITLVNNTKRFVLSVDIPSGLDPDEGRPLGICVRADMTVTMGFVKKGLISRQGKSYSGRVEVADISLPRGIK